MASSYNIGYILACGNALHVKYNMLRAEMAIQKVHFKSDVNTWTSEDEVNMLKEYFEKEEVGQLITRLSIVRSTVLKSTFGTADVDNFKAAFYDDKNSFEAAMKMSIGDNLTEANKLIINKWRDAAFPLNKDDGAAHKEALRAILFAPDINDFMNGEPWATVSEWIKKPWLMPAVQMWMKILLKYESMAENLSGNFMNDYNTTTALGKRSAGDEHLHIGEVDRRLKHQLDTVKKAFTTVDELLVHLR
eukprot:3925801-Rhodomonas_salina.1